MLNYPRGAGKRVKLPGEPPKTAGAHERDAEAFLGLCVAPCAKIDYASALSDAGMRQLLKYGPNATPDMFLGTLRGPEDRIQAAFFTRCAFRALTDPRFGMIFAVPNGQGYLSPKERQKMTLTGKKHGVPDICVAVLGRSRRAPDGCTVVHSQHHALFIEVKAGKNKASEDQIGWVMRLNEAGYKACVVTGFDELWKTLLDYFGLSG